MKMFELIPMHDGAKSFYRKAFVIIQEDEHAIMLMSYDTLVAQIDTRRNIAYVYNTQSRTTVRHIKEFLKQYNFKAETKAQIERDYEGKDFDLDAME